MHNVDDNQSDDNGRVPLDILAPHNEARHAEDMGETRHIFLPSIESSIFVEMAKQRGILATVFERISSGRQAVFTSAKVERNGMSMNIVWVFCAEEYGLHRLEDGKKEVMPAIMTAPTVSELLDRFRMLADAEAVDDQEDEEQNDSTSSPSP
jgi:hypothetical protein